MWIPLRLKRLAKSPRHEVGRRRLHCESQKIYVVILGKEWMKRIHHNHMRVYFVRVHCIAPVRTIFSPLKTGRLFGFPVLLEQHGYGKLLSHQENWNKMYQKDGPAQTCFWHPIFQPSQQISPVFLPNINWAVLKTLVGCLIYGIILPSFMESKRVCFVAQLLIARWR